ncbi:MAG: ester cyclase [Simkaniaceae bacterium]
MTVENNKALVKKYHEATNQKNIAIFDEIFAEDFKNNAMGFKTIQGIEAMKNTLEKLLAAFPDWKVKIEDIIAEKDKVALRWSLTATHLGAYEDILPTGQAIKAFGIHIDQMKNGKIFKRWATNNFPQIFQDLRSL